MSVSADSLSHQAYLALETLIVTLRLKPGSLVTERQLIDLAGQGRTPVREAIQKLAWQGLIVVRPRVGLQIAEIEPDDYAEIMQVRAKLEPLAAALVAEHATADQRARLLACAQTMTACAVSGDMAAFLAADKMFDEIMEDACPNRFLTAALAPLQTHARRLWFSVASHERMDRSISLHVAVIRAIQQGDVPGASRAMTGLMDYLLKR
ncbi:GntR family transcriptional regulator [Gellertiella hungarica]|uniref:DNA-binding GntR family transcriptional regulator n=1 Tax=Gellertiella hungarica TaxID=1572859 RepID=A0A7W6J4P3_9HYPH|nr:GntR family transcriptional regulator [Gellertiella hungarica]MBB4064723.1 DNA-binding GntR family transcriptional regulator [Gellertiella hungarica]